MDLGRVAGRGVTVEFDDVAGLKEKSDVRIAGVLVGKVAKVRLVGGKAVVDLELSRDVALHVGAPAGIQSLGMLGDKYVELLSGPARGGGCRRGRAPGQSGGVLRPGQAARAGHRDGHPGHHLEPQGSLGGAPARSGDGIVDNMLVLSRSCADLESNRAGIDATTKNFREFSTQMPSWWSGSTSSSRPTRAG